MLKRAYRAWLLSSSIAAASVLSVAPLHAQSQSGGPGEPTTEPPAAELGVPAAQIDSDPNTEAPGGESGEIVVTALKRSVSVQRTPATVDVVGRETLQTAAINTIEQLRSVAPGVIIQRPPNNTANASIRGLGTSPGPVSFDQSVALFVDGVYAARGADFLSSLFDIERIEVVKGTQAALLGKNTSLGAIVLTTRKPGRDFAVDAIANYEFVRNSKVISGGIDIPIGETFAIRVAGQYQDLGGFAKNRVDRRPAERSARQTREEAIRVTGVWRPTPDLDVTVNYAHETLRNTGIPAEVVRSSPGLVTLFNLSGDGALLEDDVDFRYAIFNSDGPSRLRQPSDRATGTLNYDFGVATVTSITSWSQFSQTRFTDNDYTPSTLYSDNTRIDGEQFSQELRVASAGDDAFSYIAGLLYIDNSLEQRQEQTTRYPGNIAGPVPVTGAYRARFKQDTKTISGFAQVGYKLADALTLTAGGRLTKERKKAELERVTVTPGRFSTLVNPPYPQAFLSRSETVFDYSVAAQYQVTPRLMLYTSYGQGTKGGGYSDFPLPINAEYDKEVARTIEAGFKLEGDDRSWRVNAAAFLTKVKDFQNNFFNGQTFTVQNLDLDSKGVEVQAFWEPITNLTFDLNGTYAKSRNLDALPGVGNRYPRSPRLAGVAAFNYEVETSGPLNYFVGGDINYRSKISHQVNPNAVPFGRPFPTLNGRIGVSGLDQRFTLSLIGRNLANKKSLSFAAAIPFVPGAVLGIPEEGRTVTLQLGFNY